MLFSSGAESEEGFTKSTHYLVKARGTNGTKTLVPIFNEPNTTGLNNGQVYPMYLAARGSKIKVASNSIVAFATQTGKKVEIEAKVSDSVCNNSGDGRVRAVNIQPKSYGIQPHYISKMRTIKFYLKNKDDRANYVTVDFRCEQNNIASNSTIAHSLIILLDNPESSSRNICDSEKSVYVCKNKSDNENCKSSDSDLGNYDNICFKGGSVTDLRNLYSIERPYVKLNSGGKKQNVLLEPGAYVIGGLYKSSNVEFQNNFLQGRGVFDGSLIPMKKVFNPVNGNTLSMIAADFSNSRIEGVITLNPYYHTASLGKNVTLNRIKTFGWAANHDSYRNWIGGSINRAS